MREVPDWREVLRDRIRMPLWDTGESLDDNTAHLFAEPIGTGKSIFAPIRSGIGWYPGPKTWADTNMTLSGQIPVGWQFTVDEIRAEPVGGCTDDDLRRITLQIVIGSRPYGEIPASQCARSLTMEHWAGLLVPSIAFGHKITPLTLLGSEQFGVLLRVSGPRAVVRVALFGELSRPMQ